MYPEFSVSGIKPEDTWQLFNTSNFLYYCQKVLDLQKGLCPFCTINPAFNEVLYENHSWRLWKNTVAPRSGQECQLIVPSKRHVEQVTALTLTEFIDLRDMIQWAARELGVGGDGVWVLRTGDPARNAKSVPHLHFNFQYPTGKDRVEVTIAKSPEDLVKKLPLLLVWEKMRRAGVQHGVDPQNVLTAEEWELVAGKMSPPTK